MTGYLWTILGLLFVGTVSASSGMFSANLFGEKLKFGIYGVSGLAPIVSMLLVGLKVADAGPYNLFIDPVVCIAWVAGVNLLFAMFSRAGQPVNFYFWLAFVVLGIFFIRLLVGNIWS